VIEAEVEVSQILSGTRADDEFARLILTYTQ
jgi:hypothetical protein